MKIRCFFIVAISFLGQILFAQNDWYLLVGTYTSGKSEGIYVYKFNPLSAENSLASTVPSSNPSFLAVSPDNKFVYAVNENAAKDNNGIGGEVSAFSFNNTKGILSPLNKKSSAGNHPCYVTIDKSGKWIYAGNYSSGTVAVLESGKDGNLTGPNQITQHTGTGPNLQRQESAHVHGTFLSPDEKYLLVPDLGADKVFIYSVDKSKGTLVPTSTPFSSAFPGAGPRHLDFHFKLPIVYVLEELTGFVGVYSFRDGKLDLIERMNLYPKEYSGALGSADIHVSPDGKFLYASNRGDFNSITIFKIDASSGKLSLVGFQSTLGKTPRNFSFDPSGNYLLVANQNSDEIVIFKVNKDTGLLTDTGKKIVVPNPVCLKWIK